MLVRRFGVKQSVPMQPMIQELGQRVPANPLVNQGALPMLLQNSPGDDMRLGSTFKAWQAPSRPA